MSRSSTKKPASNLPEFLVRRNAFNRYFDTPLPRSTFHDLVKKGTITPAKALRGFYLLNDSLRRLGLREVASLPSSNTQSGEDLVRLAFTLIDPDIFPAPPWLLFVETLEATILDHVLMIAAKHRDNIAGFDHITLKLAYFGSALDCQAMIDRGVTDLAED